MPAALVTHTAKVNAPASVMWKLLVEKVRKPHKFIPGLEEKNVEVIQDIAPLCIERRMTFENDVIHEIITADEATQTVVFKSTPAASARTLVTNTVFEEGGNVYLNFTMNRELGENGPPQGKLADAIKGAVEQTAKLAEDEASK